jgi:hypothetical protein
MACLTSARYTMLADVLRQGAGNDEQVNVSEQGHYEMDQDPVTLEIIRKWVPVTDDEDPTAPKVWSIPCQVNGIIDGGIRVAGTTERFDKDYQNIDYVRMLFGANETITKRDRITNIRNRRTGQIIWKDEEIGVDGSGEYRATVFNVNGVTPITNYRGRPIENFANLERADG